jgi:hypothetical protein
MSHRLDPLEILALGLRIASGDRESLPDDLFRSGGIRGLFESRANVIEWMKRLGVEWNGDPKTMIASVAAELRRRKDYAERHRAAYEALMKVEQERR